MSGANASQYRPDIDGLRALAIIPVVVNHYGLGIPGGFVGVDVFFVISGFLITSLLIRSIDERKFSIVTFYERRARRILPALFFMLVIASALAALVLMPLDLVGYGKSLVSTTGFSSNFLLWKESGYFDRAAELKPLLHTWSLAVEEQFYIFFPLVLWLVARLLRQRLRIVLGLALVGSFLLSIYAGRAAPTADFYLLPTRAWELLIGALLGINGVPFAANARARDAASVLGVALIIASAFAIDRNMAFPGWVAMAPCLGTALVIYASQSGGGLGNTLLKWKPLVAIGLISYSLYLWHWPLLVLAKYAANRPLATVELVGVLALAVLLSIVSWRFVERPFRGGDSAFNRRQIFWMSGVGSAIAIAVGLVFVLGNGLPGRLPAMVASYASQAADELELSAADDCFKRDAGDVRADRLCQIGADASREVSFVLWGDSHAHRMALPIGELARAKGLRGALAATGACPPLLDVNWPVPGCRAYNDEVFKLIERKHIKLVVIHALWATYAEGRFYKRETAEGIFNQMSDELGTARVAGSNAAVFARALQRTVDRLVEAGVHVVLIGPVPEVEFDVPNKVAISEWFGGDKEVGPSSEQFANRERSVTGVLQTLATRPGVLVVSPSDALCKSRCEVERAGKLLYIDDNHLSRAGLSLVEPLLGPIFP